MPPLPPIYRLYNNWLCVFKYKAIIKQEKERMGGKAEGKKKQTNDRELCLTILTIQGNRKRENA